MISLWPIMDEKLIEKIEELNEYNISLFFCSENEFLQIERDSANISPNESADFVLVSKLITQFEWA